MTALLLTEKSLLCPRPYLCLLLRLREGSSSSSMYNFEEATDTASSAGYIKQNALVKWPKNLPTRKYLLLSHLE